MAAPDTTRPQGKTPWRRLLTRLLTAAALIFMVLLAAAGLTLGWLDSGAGRDWLVGRLNRELTASGISIGESSGRLFGRLVLTEVTLHDDRGLWLRIDDLGITWRPGRLFDRELAISELSAGSVELLRLPAGPADDAAPAGPFEFVMPRLPRLPVDIALDRLRLPAISVGEAAFGVAAALAGEGEAALVAGARLRVQLSLMRIDAPDERLTVDLDYDQGADRLIAAADIAGPPGGIFAAAAGARTGEALGLRLSGSGPLSAWRGDLAAFFGERARLAADIAIIARRVAIKGAVDLVDILPGNLAGLLEPRTSFTLDLDLTGKASVPLALALESAGGSLAVEGTLDPARAERLDLAFRLAVDDAGVLAGLAGELDFAAARLSGTISGDAAAPEFKARVDFDSPHWGAQVRAGQLGLDLSGHWLDGRLDAAVTGRAKGLVAADLEPLDPELALAGSYVPGSGRIRLDSARLDVNGLRLEARGGAADSLADMALAGGLEIADLAALPVATGLAGGFAADWQLDRSPDTPLRLAISGAGSALESGTALLDKLLGTTPKLELLAGLDSAGDLLVESLTLESGRLAFGISGNWATDEERADFAWSALVDPSGLADVVGASGLAGELALLGRLEGRLSELRLSAESQLRELDIQGFRLLDPHLVVRVEDLAGMAQARLDLDADSAFGALHAGAGARREADGGTLISDLLLTLGAARIEGGFRLAADGIARGRLSGSSGDLSALPESRRYGLRGDFALVVELDESEGLQAIHLDGSGTRLGVPVGESGGLEIEHLEISGDALLAEPRPVLDMTLVIGDARTGFTRLQTVAIRASGDRETLRVSGNAEGDWRGPLDLTGAFEWRGEAAAQAFDLELAGMVFGQPVALDGPARLELAGDGWQLAPLTLLIADGSLSGRAMRHGDALELSLLAEHLPLDLVNVVAGRLVPTGRLGARLDLSQQGGMAKGVLDIDFDEVRPALGGYLDTPAFDLDGRFELDGGKLALSAIADAGAGMHTTFSGSLPVEVDLVAGRFAIPAGAPLAGRFEWHGALAPLFELADFPQHEASGDVSAAIDIAGTPEAPEFSGFVRLAEGRYENLASGFVARDIDFEGAISGRRLDLRRLVAHDGDSGTIGGSGFVALDQGGAVLADVRLDLDKVLLARRVDLRATSSGELVFHSDGETMRASGRLLPERVEIDIARSLPSDIVTIEVVEINTSTAQEDARTSEDRPAAAPLLLDLSLTAPRRIFVRGRGLDTEWSASLRVGGTSRAPEIAGNAALVKGSFDFAGRRLEVSEGSLVFPGGTVIDPILHLAARETVEGLQISVTVDGPISSPSISLSSSPSLPEDEILSRLLFGESVADLTPLEAVQLASSLAGLSGGGGLDVIGAARNALGLDRLNVELGGEDDAGTRITGGKYLSDKVYFEVSTETGTGVTAGTLEWSLTRNLSLRSRVESSRKNSVSIRWSWDY